MDSDKPLSSIKQNKDAKMVLAFLMVFCAIFASFEVLHPIAELLHTHTHIIGGSVGPGSHGAHGTEDPSYSHDPIVIAGNSSPTITGTARAFTYFRFNHPPEPFLETPSPVPIYTS